MAASAKFSTSFAVWKPSTSEASRSRISPADSGTLDRMSAEGKGMCRKKPIGAMTPRARSAAGMAIRW